MKTSLLFVLLAATAAAAVPLPAGLSAALGAGVSAAHSRSVAPVAPLALTSNVSLRPMLAVPATPRVVTPRAAVAAQPLASVSPR